MQGKAVLISGANSGIGRETTRALAQEDAAIVMACRNLAKAQTVCEIIKRESGNRQIEVMHLDLASLASIRGFTGTLAQKYRRLDVLLNNAGTFSMTRQETEDGFEMTMGVNHLGTFLLTHLVLPQLEQAPEARIINVSSNAHFQGQIDLEDLNLERKYQGFKAYANSKLANVMFTLDLADRLQDTGVTVNAVHPGHVNTGMLNTWPEAKWYQALLGKVIGLLTISAEEGAQTSIYLARSDKVSGITGQYFEKKRPKEPSPRCNDLQLRKGLWQLSEELTGLARRRDL